MPSRFRLASQARTVPAREALDGSTLLTRNTSSRRPAIASRTTSSDPPERVHFRRVDQRHAEIEAELQRRDLVGVTPAVLAHLPRAEPEHGDIDAGRQASGSDG